jgi:hypothetical protein
MGRYWARTSDRQLVELFPASGMLGSVRSQGTISAFPDCAQEWQIERLELSVPFSCRSPGYERVKNDCHEVGGRASLMSDARARTSVVSV